MKKFGWMKKVLITALTVFIVTHMGSLYVYAAETEESAEAQEESVTELNQFMVTSRKVEMKAEPNYTSETLMTYDKGASVFVIELVGDDWVLARYQEKTGYVDRTALLMQTLDVEGIDAEMTIEAEETKFVLEEVERYKQEARRSKIWGIIIIVLVVGIFAMGIVSAIRAHKGEDDENMKDEEKEKEDSMSIEDLDSESEE